MEIKNSQASLQQAPVAPTPQPTALPPTPPNVEFVADSLIEDSTLSEEGKEKAKSLLAEYGDDTLGILDENGHFPESLEEMKDILREMWDQKELDTEHDPDRGTYFVYDSDGDGEFDRSVMYDKDGKIWNEQFFDQNKSEGQIWYQADYNHGYVDNGSAVHYDGVGTLEGEEYIEQNNEFEENRRTTIKKDETTFEKTIIGSTLEGDVTDIEQIGPKGEKIFKWEKAE